MLPMLGYSFPNPFYIDTMSPLPDPRRMDFELEPTLAERWDYAIEKNHIG